MSHLETLRPPATACHSLLTRLSVYALGWQGFSADFLEVSSTRVASTVVLRDSARSVRMNRPEPSARNCPGAKDPHLHVERARSSPPLFKDALARLLTRLLPLAHRYFEQYCWIFLYQRDIPLHDTGTFVWSAAYSREVQASALACWRGVVVPCGRARERRAGVYVGLRLRARKSPPCGPL